MPVETAFLESSRSVVKAFLSSVVLVDDQAYLVARDEDTVPTKLVVPGKQGSAQNVTSAISPLKPTNTERQSGFGVAVDLTSPTVDASTTPGELTADARPSKRDHALDGKTVIDVFARIGVVCGIVRPTKEELTGLTDLMMNVGANADVIILDWVLHDSQLGEKTLELIERMTTSAADNGRARLIIVYTAEPKLVDIERSIRKRLNLEEENPADTLTIISGGTRICVYGKAGVRPAAIGEDRVKSQSELADVVVSEFTEMTKGLLSNVAMRSITAIRAKTFQLLRRFDSNVDAPYVTQSTLISPERAEEQVAALIVSEIQEILEDENVGSFADYDHIVQWLDDRIANGLTLPASNDLTSAAYRSGLIQLIRDGVRNSAVKKLKTDHAVFASKIIPDKGKDKDKEPAMYVREVLTGILRSNPALAHEADEVLTMLMSLRHRYTNPEPQLALGTIVSRPINNEQTYLLCLQPLCDSVRLKGPRPFALLSLKPAQNPKYCELIVRDGDQLKFLTLKPNPFMLEMISFSPNRNEKVMADSRDGNFVFSSSDGISFKWIADLKPAHAQRIANNVAYTFSRVGLVESEWNRLGSNF